MSTTESGQEDCSEVGSDHYPVLIELSLPSGR